MSASSSTALLPRDTNLEKPMFAPSAQSRMATHSAPLCEKKAMEPGLGWPAAKDAFTPAEGFIIPRQLGPSSAILFALHSSMIRCSRSYPSLSTSLNPAVMTMADFAPRSARASMEGTTNRGGTDMTARSSPRGRSAISVTTASPSISPPLGFTGKSFPLNPAPIMFVTMVFPTFPGEADAPMTATVSG